MISKDGIYIQWVDFNFPEEKTMLSFQLGILHASAVVYVNECWKFETSTIFQTDDTLQG